MFSLRRATGADAPAIQDLIRSVYEEYGFTWDPEGYHSDLYADFEWQYQEPHGAYWVAEEEGALIGGGGIIREDGPGGEPGTLVLNDEGLLVAASADCELVRLYLLPSARGKGVGRALAAEIVRWGRDRGCRWMAIWSDKELTLAHPFYRAMGAVPLGERVCNDPDEAEEYGFLLDLAHNPAQ